MVPCPRWLIWPVSWSDNEGGFNEEKTLFEGRINPMNPLQKIWYVIALVLMGGMSFARVQDAPELLDRVRVPTPAGYVLLEKGRG